MRLPVLSLRYDLAEASDADLAWRLEECLAAREELGPSRAREALGLRGPVRHPLAYKALCLLSAGPTGTPLDALIPLITLNRHLTDWLLSGRDSRIYLTTCEIHDLQDEIRRRLRERGRS
jgi:hypothetical protein